MWGEAGEDCVMRSFITCMLRKTLSWDEVKQNEMGRACNMHGRDEKCVHSSARKPEGNRSLCACRCRWEDNIKLDLKDVIYETVDFIHLGQDRDHWLALVNTVMNLLVS